MKSRLLNAILAILLFATALYAQEPKKCTASARECELQIRKMLSGRRYLGLSLVELKPGIVIKSVLPDGPASRADLEEGDRITGVNGHSMQTATASEFKAALAEASTTGTLWLIVQRRGALRRVEVRMQPYSKAQIDKIIAAHLAQSHSAVSGSQP